jgi:hypothetical protein
MKFPDEMPIDEFFSKAQLCHPLVHVYHGVRIDGNINTVGDLRKAIVDGFCRLHFVGPKTVAWLKHELARE